MEENMETQEKKKSKKGIICVLILVVMACIYFFTGFFVVQPIGAIPKGVTVWYIRSGTNKPFISSPDGILLERVGYVNLLGRGLILAQVMDELDDKIICKFPYQEWMYRISTKGQEFEN